MQSCVEVRTLKDMRLFNELRRSLLAGASFLALGCAPAFPQQATGVPGSPGATTTMDGKQLPPPPPAFGGVIKEKGFELDGLVGAARRAAEGRA